MDVPIFNAEVVAVVDRYFLPPINRVLIDGMFRDLITRPSLALYLARRFEMMSVQELHYFYTRPGHLPVVHSPISDKPFQRILRYNVPTTNIFILLQEGDVGFLTRTGWVYDPTVILPVLPRLAHCIIV